MRMTSHIFIVLILMAVFGMSTANAQNLGVYPTTINFNLANGQSEAQTITISNGSSKKVQFRTYLNDWIRDTVGGHAYYDPGTLKNSCSKWVSVDKNFIELEPGETAQLTVQIRVPDAPDATSGMKWSMLFIETVQEQLTSDDTKASASVRNLLRIGVHIYQTPPGVSEKSIMAVDLKPIPDVKNVYNFLCQNTGDVMLECKAYLQLTSLASGEETKLDFVEFPMFPGQRRYVTFELPKNMPEGKYNVLGVLDAGDDIPLEAVETDIEITAPQADMGQ